MSDTRTRFLKVFTDHFGAIETTAADPLDAKFTADLKPDSLDVIEVVMDLEEAFKVEISDDEVEGFEQDATLRMILALVESKLGVAA